MQKKPSAVTWHRNSSPWNRKYSAGENKQYLLLEASDSSQNAFHEPRQRNLNATDEKVLELVL
jgi:hypothetical protein